MPKLHPIGRPSLFISTWKESLNCLFYIPNKGTKTKTLGLLIDTMEFFKQWFYLLITHYRKDSRTHRGPCMTTIVWFTGLATTALYLGKHRETTTVQVVKGKKDLFLICLVVGNKYRFHIL